MRARPYVLAGFKRSGTNFLRSYFDNHPSISWSRNGYILLNAKFDSESSNDWIMCFDTESEVHIDVCEHLALGWLVSDAEEWEKHRVVPDFHFNKNSESNDVEKIIKRIYSLKPEAKIIIIIRNQIEWLRTHFRVFKHRLPRRKNSFIDFLTTAEGRLIIDAGRYDYAVSQFQRYFGSENVHAILLEDLRVMRNEVLQELCGFLDVRFVDLPETSARYNASGTNTQALISSTSAARLFKKFIPPRLMPAVKSLANEFPDVDLLKEKDKRLLSAMFSHSNQRLSKILNRDISSLGYPVESPCKYHASKY